MWEGRFTSQVLLDENTVLACMAYVDLNPIRTKMETTLETSKHTCIQQRIRCLIEGEQPRKHIRFTDNHTEDMLKGTAYSLIYYCELVDALDDVFETTTLTISSIAIIQF